MKQITWRDIYAALRKQGVDHKTALRFVCWLDKNRELWEAFEHCAMLGIHSGKRQGAKGVMEDVREHYKLENKNADFKCNNSYTAYLLRAFLVKHPEYHDRFETRELRGLKDAA